MNSIRASYGRIANLVEAFFHNICLKMLTKTFETWKTKYKNSNNGICVCVIKWQQSDHRRIRSSKTKSFIQRIKTFIDFIDCE